jgi:polyisoprenoid-binding protein YceI
MRTRTLLMTGCVLSTLSAAVATAQESPDQRPPLVLSSVTVTVEGTSKRAPFFASTRTVHISNLRLAAPRSQDVLAQVLRPGQLEALEVTIPVASLTSPDRGVEEHIRSSLKAETHPEIRFRLRSLDQGPDTSTGLVRLIAKGTLTIAGVERDAALSVTVLRAGRSLIVDGGTGVLMTDFGVKPPAGLLGLLGTDPLIHVRFYLFVNAAD